MSGRGRSVRFRISRDLTGSFERQRISEPHFLAASELSRPEEGFCLGSPVNPYAGASFSSHSRFSPVTRPFL